MNLEKLLVVAGMATVANVKQPLTTNCNFALRRWILNPSPTLFRRGPSFMFSNQTMADGDNEGKRRKRSSTKIGRIDNSQTEEIVEAEPVGNFIKDQSLVLNSTRMHRFTEKYRDSVVDRILGGKVSISSLTANGEFSEAELRSWIADKENRQTEKIETLDVDIKSQTQQRHSGL